MVHGCLYGTVTSPPEKLETYQIRTKLNLEAGLYTLSSTSQLRVCNSIYYQVTYNTGQNYMWNWHNLLLEA